MMDKEAITAIERNVRLQGNNFADGSPIHTHHIAHKILIDLRELGYRKLPKDKPPLLNPEARLSAEDRALEYLHSQGKVVGKDGFKRRDIAYTVREFIAQAQRESDIKHYENEEG